MVQVVWVNANAAAPFETDEIYWFKNVTMCAMTENDVKFNATDPRITVKVAVKDAASVRRAYVQLERGWRSRVIVCQWLRTWGGRARCVGAQGACRGERAGAGQDAKRALRLSRRGNQGVSAAGRIATSRKIADDGGHL